MLQSGVQVIERGLRNLDRKRRCRHQLPPRVLPGTRRRDFALLDRFLVGPTRSGSFLPPVSRFHSSKVCSEIFPATSSWANFRRCA
jgi:hypothetical protein